MSAVEHHTVKFFNTMSRKVEEFKSIAPDSVGIYTCGPTVYNFAHIGNFRAYVFEDILCRTLRYFNYDVTQIMNLTDVDDKTIRDSQKAGLPLMDFTAKYIAAFFDDLKTLRITPAKHYPPATGHIPEMIAPVQTLLDKGYAYTAPDNCVYFSIAKFPEYGKLAKIDRETRCPVSVFPTMNTPRIQLPTLPSGKHGHPPTGPSNGIRPGAPDARAGTLNAVP